MKSNENEISLPVDEYCEGYPVKFIENAEDCNNSNRDIIVAVNEGGYNCVWIDARQLYEWLKEHYENN